MKVFNDFFTATVTCAPLPEEPEDRPPQLTLAFHFAEWKQQLLRGMFPDREFVFVPIKEATKEAAKWVAYLAENPRADIFVWGMNSPAYLQDTARAAYYVEDGFIRSVGLGSKHTLPFSLSVDQRTPYFNAREQSDLEFIINEYPFVEDSEIMQRAAVLMDRIVNRKLSKYNHSDTVDLSTVYGSKERYRILVIGQVEDDASITYGCTTPFTNTDLVTIARLENPDAQIIYKPHPDVYHKLRPELSDPAEVAHLCQILDVDAPLDQALEGVDHVYTITSQAGFEALMRGVKVTVLGCPFYAGWGLADERTPCARRTARRTVLEVFAAAYLLYPVYYDPIYKRDTTPEEAVDMITALRDLQRRKPKPEPVAEVAETPLRNLLTPIRVEQMWGASVTGSLTSLSGDLNA